MREESKSGFEPYSGRQERQEKERVRELEKKQKEDVKEKERLKKLNYVYPDMTKTLGAFKIHIENGVFNASETVVMLG